MVSYFLAQYNMFHIQSQIGGVQSRWWLKGKLCLLGLKQGLIRTKLIIDCRISSAVRYRTTPAKSVMSMSMTFLTINMKIRLFLRILVDVSPTQHSTALFLGSVLDFACNLTLITDFDYM